MKKLHFKKFAEIVQVCSMLPLDNVVLILTGNEHVGGMLVYLDEVPSITVQENWQTKTLNDLQDEDFLFWNGLSVGYDALNFAYPMMVPFGANFYSIRYLFTDLDHLDIYQKNGQKLALWLYQRYSKGNPSNRFITKIFELLAPSWLASKQPEKSIGLALSSSNLTPFIAGEEQPNWVTLTDLEDGLIPVEFLVTFNEIKQLFPHLEKVPHFIEWRPLLWKNEKEKILISALEDTAQFFYKQSENLKRPHFYRLAYAFAMEKWLSNMDTEHLVAVFPSMDFKNFLKTGNAIYIKKTPKIYVGSDGEQKFFTLLDLTTKKQNLLNKIGGDFHGTAFCIKPLSQLVQSHLSSQPCSLESVLYAVGKAPDLATTFLNFASDFIQYGELKSVRISPEEVRNIALRGTYLLALGDPWNKTWHGRYNLLLDKAYAILNDALLYAEKAGNDHQGHLLRTWYGLYPERNLSIIRNELSELELETTEESSTWEKHIFYILRGEEIPVKIDGKHIQELQTTSASWEEIYPMLTKDFLGLYHEWVQAHQRRIALEQSLVHSPPSIERIKQTLNVFNSIQRRLYALPHEVVVLEQFCNEDIDALEKLQSALSGSITLQVDLQTRRIFTEKVTRLLFEIHNIGDKEVKNIEMLLEETPQYKIIGRKSQSLASIPPHTKGHILEWHIQTHEEGMFKICLTILPSKNNDFKREVFEFSINAKTEKLLRPRGGNPFQAGAAVAGDKFFGRSKTLEFIFETYLFWTKQAILLRGPRRIGKTSILHQIKHMLDNRGELQHRLGYDYEDEMQLRQVKAVFSTLENIQKEEEIPGWYYKLYTDILEETGLVEYQVERSAFDLDPHYIFERHIRKIFKKHPQLHLAILIDEWDAERHLKTLGGKLRALIQSDLPLNWVISSTWMLENEQNKYPSLFYAQLRGFELEEMDWEEGRDLVETLSERVGVTWQEDALVTLLRQTGLRPSLMQALGQRIITHINSPKYLSNIVSKETVLSIVSDYIQEANDQVSPFAFLWEAKTPQVRSQKSKAHLSWFGRLILLSFMPSFDLSETQESKNLNYKEIRDILLKKIQEYKISFFTSNQVDDELDENLMYLELIFDVIKLEKKLYSFSIPIAWAWFRKAISQHEDPWQFAFEQMKKELIPSKAMKKEK